MGVEAHLDRDPDLELAHPTAHSFNHVRPHEVTPYCWEWRRRQLFVRGKGTHDMLLKLLLVPPAVSAVLDDPQGEGPAAQDPAHPPCSGHGVPWVYVVILLMCLGHYWEGKSS